MLWSRPYNPHTTTREVDIGSHEPPPSGGLSWAVEEATRVFGGGRGRPLNISLDQLTASHSVPSKLRANPPARSVSPGCAKPWSRFGARSVSVHRSFNTPSRIHRKRF